MPELPEIETVKHALESRVIGNRFTRVELFWAKAVREPLPEELRKRLVGQQIESLSRRGKYLLIRLLAGETLIIHLKMTGVLLLKSVPEGPQKHTTAIFRLDGGTDLHFIDQRKFGSIWLVADENLVIGKLGPEPLDGAFTPAVLRKVMSRRSIPIKARLLDQNVIAGMGNMYTDEALFAARINPLKKAGDLTVAETGRLYDAIIDVLQRGIRYNGASVSTYRLPDGTEGMAQTHFRVAHRRGESCPVCGSTITRITIRGRGTYFCPDCQHA